MDSDQNKKILIAEDNDDSRVMLRVFLESHNYFVVEARNGEEAVRLAEREKPDLILMDLNMPEMDGISAVSLIRNITELSKVPIIAISAFGDLGMNLFLNIKNLGDSYISYITKPVNLEELSAQIKFAL